MVETLDTATLAYNLSATHGLRLPQEAMIIDLDTTDTRATRGYAWRAQLGVVRGGEMAEQVSLRLRVPDEHYPHGCTAEQDRETFRAENAQAVEYAKAMEHLVRTVRAYEEARRGTFIGCGSTSFDFEWLALYATSAGLPFKHPTGSRLLDVGMQIKAAKVPMRVIPGEDARAFYLRVGDRPCRGVTYSMENNAKVWPDILVGGQVTAASYWRLTQRIYEEAGRAARAA